MWQFFNQNDHTIYWRDIRWELAIWKNLKVEHRLTIYEKVNGHNPCARALREKELVKWLQQQKLKTVTYPSDPSMVAKE